MSAIDPRTPVIIGAAQHIVPKGAQPGPEPLDVWETTVRAAADDAGLSTTTLARTDGLSVVNCLSWNYDHPVARLGERLGTRPASEYYTSASGTSGHKALHRAATAIASGDSDLAVVVGSESLATRRHYAKAGAVPGWSHPSSERLPGILDGQHPDEIAIGLTADVGAVYSFALRDIARRAHLGIAPDEYRRRIATLFSGMTQVAADNPYAWFRTARTAEFLADVRPDNRMVSYPYTKHLVAIMDVDLAGALVVASTERADALGVPAEQRVYPWAGALVSEHEHIAVRPDLWRSEGMELASRAVLQAADIGIDQVAHLDLYSCFPAAVNFAQDALGTDLPGDRITVTGGLPYAGGAASSYMLNSLATLVGLLRADPGTVGLASGVGMLMSDHAFGLYSTEPPTPAMRTVDNAGLQRDLDRRPLVGIDREYSGPAVVATYTVMHDVHGEPSHGAAIVDLPNGARAYARISDPDLLRQAEVTEFVGQPVSLRRDDRGPVVSP